MFACKCLCNIPYTNMASMLSWQVWCCFLLWRSYQSSSGSHSLDKKHVLYSNEGVTNMKHIRNRSQSLHDKFMYKLSITPLFRRTIFSTSLKYDTIPAKWPNNYSNPSNTKTCSLTRYDCVIPRIISHATDISTKLPTMSVHADVLE